MNKAYAAILMVWILTGCSALKERSLTQISGTSFENGGVSEKTLELQRLSRQKGQNDATVSESLKKSRTDDLSAVMRECNELLYKEGQQRRKASDAGLFVAIAGLLSGSIIGPTLVSASASKASITFFSSVAGGTNILQTELKDRGYDPQQHIDRIVAVKTAVKSRAEEFFKANNDGDRERAIINLSSDCLAS